MTGYFQFVRAMKNSIQLSNTQAKSLLSAVSDYLGNFVVGSPTGQALERATLRSDAGKNDVVKSFVRLHRLLRHQITA